MEEKQAFCVLQPEKVTIIHGCFLNSTNGTKLRQASHIYRKCTGFTRNGVFQLWVPRNNFLLFDFLIKTAKNGKRQLLNC